jgi:hypothetical protein
MKTIKTVLTIVLFGAIATLNAQEAKVSQETRITTNQEKLSYYEQRGSEDANYELKFKAKSKSDEESFWKEQKQYEIELKKDNRRAYRAYMQGKKDAYAEHHHHCDDHCYHSDSFYHHAGFYYYEYDQRNYQRSPSRTSVKTQVGVPTPSVRLGIF